MQLQLIPDRPPLQVINIISGWVSTVFLHRPPALLTSCKYTKFPTPNIVTQALHVLLDCSSPAVPESPFSIIFHFLSLDFSQRRTNRKERKPRQSDKYEPCQGPLTPHWACPFTGDFMAEDRASRLATQMDYCHWPRIVHFSGICLPGICCTVLRRGLDRR